jgi:hypothetical protein
MFLVQGTQSNTRHTQLRERHIQWDTKTAAVYKIERKSSYNISINFQCVRLTGHVTLRFNNHMSTAEVFLHIEETFDTTWHLGLLYNLPKLKFVVGLIKVISSFLLREKIQSLGRR